MDGGELFRPRSEQGKFPTHPSFEWASPRLTRHEDDLDAGAGRGTILDFSLSRLTCYRSVDRGDDEDDEDQVQEKDLVGQGRGGGPLEHFGPLFDLLTCFIYLSKKMSGLRL